MITIGVGFQEKAPSIKVIPSEQTPVHPNWEDTDGKTNVACLTTHIHIVCMGTGTGTGIQSGDDDDISSISASENFTSCDLTSDAPMHIENVVSASFQLSIPTIVAISIQNAGAGIPNKENSCWLISILQLTNSTHFHHFLSGNS